MNAIFQKGFTQFELIMVIILTGIIGVIIIPRISAPGDYTLSHQTDRFASQIRHVQSLSMFWGCELNIMVSANTFQVQSNSAITNKPCAASGTLITNPVTQQNYTDSFDDGVNISDGNLAFDHLGRPVSGGSLIDSVTSYSLSYGGTSWNINVQPLTGFVSVQKL